MNIYKAPIGRSLYEIPYDSPDDLSYLKQICGEVNKMVNAVLATDNTITNEFAILLALINKIYEIKFENVDSKTAAEKSQDIQKTYSSDDILRVINYMRGKLLEIQKC